MNPGMNLHDLVLGPLRVVEATLDDSGGHTLRIWLCRPGHSPILQDEGSAATAKCLATVTVAGRGVVTKPARSPLALRVQAAPETFSWSETDGEIAFVRRDRLRRLLEELDSARIRPQRIFVGIGPEEAASRSRALFRLRMLVGATVEGSAAAQVVVRRIGPPILGLFLLLAAGNAVLASHLRTRRQELRSELAASERTASAAESAAVRQRALRMAFAAESAVAHASLCDGIAAAVPERVVLTSLAIEPPLRRPEAGKPLVRAERTAVVCGEAPAAADISEFATRLGREPALRNVRLAQMERERDGDRLTFRIESDL